MKYRMIFADKENPPSKDLLQKIKEKHENDIEGISQYYNELIKNNTFDTLEAPKFYYVAYTLALEGIELVLIRVN